MVPVLAEFIAIQTLNSLVYSMLLFLLALGLSLTFGLLRVVNLAHGGFYLLGAYVGLSVWTFSHSFLVAVVIAPLAAGLIGALLEKLWLRHFYARAELDQVILTFGFALVFADVMKMLWGKDIRGVPAPSTLAGAVQLGDFAFPSYRLLLIAVGLDSSCDLACDRAYPHRRTDPGLGRRPRHGRGARFQCALPVHGDLRLRHGLAGLAGWLAAPITGVYPGLDFEVLITTLIVVVVGGLGNIVGAFWASLLIGGSETFGKAMLPEFASFIIFGVMAAVLLFRSWGRDEEEVE